MTIEEYQKLEITNKDVFVIEMNDGRRIPACYPSLDKNDTLSLNDRPRLTFRNGLWPESCFLDEIKNIKIKSPHEIADLLKNLCDKLDQLSLK